jgi:ribonuclease HII
MLRSSLTETLVEAGCDEAGRGCLAGPVYAAAVILPADYHNPYLNDSKKLSARQREKLRIIIEKDAVTWAVAAVDNHVIDQINILNASIQAMHLALEKLSSIPELILIDGNRFHPFRNISHRCIIKGDSKYMSIAAASILAKTYRDDFMVQKSMEFPQYGWKSNKGYPTKAHRLSIHDFGLTPYHRLSFRQEKTFDLFTNSL